MAHLLYTSDIGAMDASMDCVVWFAWLHTFDLADENTKDSFVVSISMAVHVMCID